MRAATAMFKDGVKVYPLAQTGKAPAMEFISASGKAFNTIHANNYEFYGSHEWFNEVPRFRPVSGIPCSLGCVQKSGLSSMG